jgi:hypothetical protein
MKKIILVAMAVLVTGCSTMYPTKKTEFYKDGKLVKTYIGRGMYDFNGSYDTYRIWSMDSWKYYEFKCSKCEIVETPVAQGK